MLTFIDYGGVVQRGGDQPVTGSAASRVITRDQALSPFAISRRMSSCLLLSKSCCAYKPWEGRGVLFGMFGKYIKLSVLRIECLNVKCTQSDYLFDVCPFECL